MLKANGIDFAKMDVLKADPGALAPMLATGKVAGTINWVTVAPAFVKTLAETGKKLKVIQWSDYGFDGYGLSLFASEKILSECPETAKKFLLAYMKATAMAIADPSAAAAAVKAMVPEIDVDVARRRQFAVSVPLMVNDTARRTLRAPSRRHFSPRPGNGPARRRTFRSTSSTRDPRWTVRSYPNKTRCAAGGARR